MKGKGLRVGSVFWGGTSTKSNIISLPYTSSRTVSQRYSSWTPYICDFFLLLEISGEPLLPENELRTNLRKLLISRQIDQLECLREEESKLLQQILQPGAILTDKEQEIIVGTLGSPNFRMKCVPEIVECFAYSDYVRSTRRSCRRMRGWWRRMLLSNNHAMHWKVASVYSIHCGSTVGTGVHHPRNGGEREGSWSWQAPAWVENVHIW